MPRLPVEGSIAPARAKRLMTVHSVTYARMTPGRGGCVAVTRGPAEPGRPLLRARPGTARMTGSASRVHEPREDPSTAGARINHRAVCPPHDPCDVGGTAWVRDQWLHDVQAGVLSSRTLTRCARPADVHGPGSVVVADEFPCAAPLQGESPSNAQTCSPPARYRASCGAPPLSEGCSSRGPPLHACGWHHRAK